MKMKFFDVAAPVLLILALVIIYFFWGCKWALYLTIVAGVIIIVTALIANKQNKKIKELQDKIESK